MDSAADRPEIWVVGQDHWPRALLRAELIERGYEVVGFAALTDALVRLAVQRATPALVIVDLHHQTVTDRSVHAFARRGCKLMAIFGSPDWADPTLRRCPWSVALKRPITLGDVANAAERLVREPPSGPA